MATVAVFLDTIAALKHSRDLVSICLDLSNHVARRVQVARNNGDSVSQRHWSLVDVLELHGGGTYGGHTLLRTLRTLVVPPWLLWSPYLCGGYMLSPGQVFIMGVTISSGSIVCKKRLHFTLLSHRHSYDVRL